MSKGKDKTIDLLSGIFEDFGTAQVLTTPTDDGRDQALELAKSMPPDLFLRDLAILMAKYMADMLEQRSLRAADYADMLDVPNELLKLIKSNVSKEDGREYFTEVFLEHLKARG